MRGNRNRILYARRVCVLKYSRPLESPDSDVVLRFSGSLTLGVFECGSHVLCMYRIEIGKHAVLNYSKSFALVVETRVRFRFIYFVFRFRSLPRVVVVASAPPPPTDDPNDRFIAVRERPRARPCTCHDGTTYDDPGRNPETARFRQKTDNRVRISRRLMVFWLWWEGGGIAGRMVRKGFSAEDWKVASRISGRFINRGKRCDCHAGCAGQCV